MNKILDPQKVTTIFKDCLFKEGEDTRNPVKVEGITLNVGFHPNRLDDHKTEIEAMLNELPDQFQASKGGGWSFLNACVDKHGEQWTGLHEVMEQLFLLGMGIRKVECPLPRKTWRALPGCMPYFLVTA